MMDNDPEDPASEYEETINKLSDQITELFSQIHFYQALIAEKEHQIKQLTQENGQLMARIQNLSYTLPPAPPQKSYTPPPAPPQQLYTPPLSPPEQSYTPPSLPSLKSTNNSIDDSRINKRVCPNCGAMGFAIREIDDKSNIISYSPRRMYAKKKTCTKCKYEW